MNDTETDPMDTETDPMDETPWARVHADIQREAGVILFTVLRFTRDGARMERVYSSHPGEYPVGGAKDVATEVSPEWIAVSRDAGRPFFGPAPADLERIFQDAALIRSLGCGSILNVPVKDSHGRVRGTVSLCAAEGSYTPERIERAVAIIDRYAGTAVDPAPEANGRPGGAR